MRRERGISFVIVLAVLTALVALVSGFAATQRAAVRESAGRSERLRARVLAEAGIQRAMAELLTVAADATLPTELADTWATLGQNGAEEFSLSSGTFRLQIVDGSGRLDLNTAPQEALTNLGLTTEQVDSLLDWREIGQAQATRPEGAKDSYYNALPEPYNARLGPLQSVDELLLIKGFTTDALYRPGFLNENSTAASGVTPGEEERPLADLATVVAYAPNDDENGDARLNLNVAQGVTARTIAQRLTISEPLAQTIIDGRPGGAGYTRLSQVLALGGVQGDQNAWRQILDRGNIVAGDRLSGKINFNTAPIEVLSAIPNVGPDLGRTIVDRQSSSPFIKLSDILEISTTLPFAQALADYAATRSATFLVRSVGKAGETTVALTATVVLEAQAPRLLRIEEAPFGNMPTRWAWDDVTTTTSLQEAPNE